tara:strand:+ start:23382 stop:23924 length:543 start_codon:yes stop_codon:yes gene_type:complete
MNKFIVGLLLVVGMFVGASCAVFGDEQLVITTQEQVQEGAEFEVIPIDQIPVDLVALLPEGSIIVLTDRDNLKEDATYVSMGFDESEGNLDGILKTALGIGSIFVPGLAAWEGVLTMFSKRKRKHYSNAAKKATPIGEGPMDWGGMFASIKSALGSSHSSSETEVTFAMENAPAQTPDLV